MIAHAKHDDAFGSELHEIGRSRDQRIQVIALAVDRPKVVLIGSLVELALHGTEEITEVEDTGSMSDSFLQVLLLQLPVG